MLPPGAWYSYSYEETDSYGVEGTFTNAYHDDEHSAWVHCIPGEAKFSPRYPDAGRVSVGSCHEFCNEFMPVVMWWTGVIEESSSPTRSLRSMPMEIA